MFTRFKRVLKNFFESDERFGMLDLLIVVAIVIVIGMLQVRDAIAGSTDSYHIKQTSTRGSVRFVDTGIPLGGDTWNAPAVPVTETTILTEWRTDPFFWIREEVRGRLVSRPSELLVRFIVLPQTPEERLCKIQEALVFDPKFKGFKLQTNPTATSTGDCTYLKFERMEDGRDVWSMYGADRIGPDGKPYCPN